MQKALHKFGSNLRDARWRRRISVNILAERASISRTTLAKIEQGYTGVSLGNYATVLFVLGMLDSLATLLDPSQDELGLLLESERLPKRIRQPRK